VPTFIFEAVTEADILPDRYFEAVEEYKNRKFSFDIDILAAFSGIANLLAGNFGGYSICGLPTTVLHEALLWDSDLEPLEMLMLTGEAVRRDEEIPHFSTLPILRGIPSIRLPSWCWAGWRIIVDYGGVYHPNFEALVDIFCVYSKRPEASYQVATKAVGSMYDTDPAKSSSTAEVIALLEATLQGKSLNTIVLAFWARTAPLLAVAEEFWDLISQFLQLHLARVENPEECDFVPLGTDDDTTGLKPDGFERTIQTLVIRWDHGVAHRIGHFELAWRIWGLLHTEEKFIILV